jgi:uncharacterized membrane protein
MKILTLILLAMAGILLAHEPGEHAAKAVKEAKAAVVAGGQAVQTAAVKAVGTAEAGVSKAGQAVQNAGEAVIQKEPFKAMKEGALDHMHNKIVHFPIALGFFGAIFLLLSFRYPSYKWPARVLLFFAGAFAVAALFTGEAQEAAFDGTSFQAVLAWHEKAAKVSLVLIWGAFLLSFFEVTRKFFWLYALVLFWFLLTAGTLGGVLAAS